MKVRVPASSANLGPGFDALALALELYVSVEIRLDEPFSITTAGYGAEITDPEQHLGVRLARQILGHSNFALSVESEIPLARGLGSSAALAVAVAVAAGSNDPLAIGIEVDGHAENAAASLYGGLVSASHGPEGTFVAPLALDPELRFVVVIPERELATADARRVLPEMVSYHDAAFNISRAALLSAGLADHRRLSPRATEDRLHQPYRSALLPFSAPLLEAMVEAGALASCWSGAGSTMLGIAHESRAHSVAEAAAETMNGFAEIHEVLVVNADHRGVQTLS